jgi:hypothetical protein
MTTAYNLDPGAAIGWLDAEIIKHHDHTTRA